MRDSLLLACGSRESRAALRSIFEDNYNLLEAETGKQAMLRFTVQPLEPNI